jgi:hypothetical protein
MKHKIYFAVLLMAAITVLLFSCNQPKEKDETILPANNTAEPATAKQNNPADKSLLVDNWARTDAPYQLKITALQEDANLTAGYFNPKPINAGKDMWDNKDGILKCTLN